MRKLLLVGLSFILLSACAPGVSPGVAPTPIPTDDVHLITSVQGDLSVKREGWSSYVSAPFGTMLRRGDLLRLTAQGEATVLCADFSLRNISVGINSVPCLSRQTNDPKLGRGTYRLHDSSNSAASIPRGANLPGDVPRVITPRSTRIRASSAPTIRWTRTAGASSYTVTVSAETGQGTRVVWQSTQPAETDSVVPDTWPDIEPHVNYKVTVTTEQGRAEMGQGLGFTALASDTAEDVRLAEEKIGTLGLADDSQRLVLAHLYADNQLYVEAIDQLEPLAAAGRSAAVLQLLGNIHSTTGLQDLAILRYGEALEVARTTADLEGQALAEVAIGTAYRAGLGNRAEATQHYRAALSLYQEFGDVGKITVLQEWLVND